MVPLRVIAANAPIATSLNRLILGAAANVATTRCPPRTRCREARFVIGSRLVRAVTRVLAHVDSHAARL